jgi:xanthine dehydrogenase accessory factor
MENIYQKIAESQQKGIPTAICTVIHSTGSTPRKAGAKMLVYLDGSIFGTIGGGSIEKQVIEDAIKCLHDNDAKKNIYQLKDDLGMHCGGTMEVFIELLSIAKRLYIFGAGHIGRVVARYSLDFGFTPILIDNRQGIFDNFELQGAETINEDYFKAMEHIEKSSESYVVILTHKHAHDEDIVAKLAIYDFKYIGMIGSKNKVALAKKRFLEENILTEEQITRVDMPIGIKLNAQTPEEIAISIIAKLIDVKNA